VDGEEIKKGEMNLFARRDNNGCTFEAKPLGYG